MKNSMIKIVLTIMVLIFDAQRLLLYLDIQTLCIAVSKIKIADMVMVFLIKMLLNYHMTYPRTL